MSVELVIGLFAFMVTIVIVWMVKLSRSIDRIRRKSNTLTGLSKVIEDVEKKTLAHIKRGTELNFQIGLSTH